MTDLEFLTAIKSYMEEMEAMEERVDGEWGACRTADELIRAGIMPQLYTEVVRRIEALAKPVPQGPTDEELHQLWLDLYAFHDGPTSGDVAEIARAVLARWGRPISETHGSS